MDIRDRVRMRVEAMGLNPFALAKRGGFQRNFINDIVKGHKKGVHPDNLPGLAAVLRCSEEYLLGQSDDVGGPVSAHVEAAGIGEGLPYGGVCETGVWRPRKKNLPDFQKLVPVARDVRYGDLDQIAFAISDPEEAIMPRSCIAIGSDTRQYSAAYGQIGNGARIVARRTSGELCELSYRRVQWEGDAMRLEPASPADDGDPMVVHGGKDETGREVEIVAIVTMHVELLTLA